MKLCLVAIQCSLPAVRVRTPGASQWHAVDEHKGLPPLLQPLKAECLLSESRSGSCTIYERGWVLQIVSRMLASWRMFSSRHKTASMQAARANDEHSRTYYLRSFDVNI